jgi:hypothetical protein
MKIVIQTMGEQCYLDYLTPKLPGAVWVYDRYRDAMETFARCLAAAGDGPCLHMEDDAILTRNFLLKAEKVIERVGPDKVIQFFSMRGADLAQGSRWDRNFISNVCWYAPRGFSNGVLCELNRWKANHPEHPTGVDLAVCDFLKANRMKYWIEVPNLADHRSDKSRIDPRRSTKRQSKTFIDPWQ